MRIKATTAARNATNACRGTLASSAAPLPSPPIWARPADGRSEDPCALAAIGQSATMADRHRYTTEVVAPGQPGWWFFPALPPSSHQDWAAPTCRPPRRGGTSAEQAAQAGLESLPAPGLKHGASSTMTKTYTQHSNHTPALGSTSRASTAVPDPSSAAKPSTAALRRAVLAGDAATLALVTGTAAAVGASPASPDAGLIALCAALDGLQRQIDGLFPADWRGITDAELEAADAAARCIEEEQRLLLGRFCALLPSTLGGCAAMARSLALLRPDLVRAGPNADNADMDVRLTALLVRGMIGEGA